MQSTPLDLEWALPRSASMPEPVSRARQRLIQQIMAEQQAAGVDQPPVLPLRVYYTPAPFPSRLPAWLFPDVSDELIFLASPESSTADR